MTSRPRASFNGQGSVANVLMTARRGSPHDVRHDSIGRRNDLLPEGEIVVGPCAVAHERQRARWRDRSRRASTGASREWASAHSCLEVTRVFRPRRWTNGSTNPRSPSRNGALRNAEGVRRGRPPTERGAGVSSGDLWQCCRYCWQHCPRLASGHPGPARAVPCLSL